jgi:predicted phosphodiesterase
MQYNLRPLLDGSLTLRELKEKTGLSTTTILDSLGELGAILGEMGGWYIPSPDNAEEVDSYLMLQRVGQTRLNERKLLKYLISEENRRRDALQILSDSNTPIKIEKKPGHSDATAVMVFSDNHYAEVIKKDMTYGLNEHNPEISEKRILSIAQKALEKTLKFRTVQNIDRLILAFIGDHIHGDIHEPYVEVHGNAMTVLEETAAVSRLLLSILSFFNPHFSEIDVICVPGNHGRATQKKRENQNEGYSYEQFMFCNLAERSKDLDLNAKFHISTERMQFAEVYGRKLRFMHGDDVKGGANVHNSVVKYLDRIDKIGLTADVTFMGHFHQAVASSRYIINGCTCGPNLYSLTCGYAPEPPTQALALITEHGFDSVSFISP